MRKVCNYKNADVENMQQSISGIDLDISSIKTRGNIKVQIFNESLNNTFHKFIPNKIMKSYYKQPPPWMSKAIKPKIKKLTKTFVQNVKIAYLN